MRSWRKWILGFFEYKVVSQRGLDNSHLFNLGIFVSDNMLIRAYIEPDVVTLRCY